MSLSSCLTPTPPASALIPLSGPAFHKNYNLGELIGEGAFSKVKAATVKTPGPQKGMQVAVKCIERQNLPREDEEDLLEEVRKGCVLFGGGRAVWSCLISGKGGVYPLSDSIRNRSWIEETWPFGSKSSIRKIHIYRKCYGTVRLRGQGTNENMLKKCEWIVGFIGRPSTVR